MISVIVQGVALSSIWFWLYALIKKDERSMRTLFWWAKVIVPQGIVIAFALRQTGIL
jgi:hypothetical protein